MRARTFIGGVLLAACAQTAFAHERNLDPLYPDVLLERLVEIYQDGQQEGHFPSEFDDTCVPHECLEKSLDELSDEGMIWLGESEEAFLPSSYFERLPASLSYSLLYGLVDLLIAEELSDTQADLQSSLLEEL